MDLDSWANFFVIAGGGSGALTGLVFVAISLKSDQILGSPALRKTAAQTLVLLISPLFIALLATTPNLPRAVLAVECIVGAVALWCIQWLIGRAMDLTGASARTRQLHHLTPNLLVGLFILAAGVGLLFGIDGALYAIVPAIVAAVIGGVVNAWLFVIGFTEWDQATTNTG